MGILASILIVIAIITVFFHYSVAVLLVGGALLLFGGKQLQAHNKPFGYIQIIGGFVLIIGILITGM